MRTIDLSPLYRSFIGSDRLASLADAASRNQHTYPPYNIELLGEDKYRISMAVAGFGADDVTIEAQENALTVTGKKPSDTSPTQDEKSSKEGKKYLHQGISSQSFERKFQLGDHVKVIGADLQHGLLHIDLERVVPEAKKPQKIEIGTKQEA
ncbi:Hsp20 family protein [Alteromonas pelagimontana]|uniref:Hsp20 family protein n=1 Tax=Alteromonas pelagimontana TaxID=1858656 RepID=A0A6M4MHS7_9ALTE|nr:Hsp20 family protein [Alteromonas pelagimontana]QJR82180.1 Hsp20 family protein [Alteromonas pelagimontana]